MDFQKIVDSLGIAASIVSVEKLENGDYGKLRIVTGNRAYLDTIEKPAAGVELMVQKFIPNSEYTTYMPRDLNFEDSCYQAAVNKQSIHAYAHPERFDVWFDMSFIPIEQEEGNLCYCIYTVEIDFKPDAKRMSNFSSEIASSVLETCIKLRSHNDFKSTMGLVCEDIRDLCGSESCIIILMDTEHKKCSLLCEAYSDAVQNFSMNDLIDDSFYDMAYSWVGTIAGSNCLMIKNQHDLDVIKERNPAWYKSLERSHGKTLVLFPLEFKDELLGFIWAANVKAESADIIKETLELTSFILASELYSYKLLDELHVLSSTDMLTGVYNRNAMNNYVDSLVSEKNQDSSTMGVVFADVNGLKRTNDSVGHFAGDLLLKNSALVLQKYFPECKVYRAGGDEFVVIVPDISDDRLSEMVEKMRETTSQPTDEVCFAIGWSTGKASDIRQTMHEADEKMYADKKQFYALHPEFSR